MSGALDLSGTQSTVSTPSHKSICYRTTSSSPSSRSTHGISACSFLAKRATKPSFSPHTSSTPVPSISVPSISAGSNIIRSPFPSAQARWQTYAPLWRSSRSSLLHPSNTTCRFTSKLWHQRRHGVPWKRQSRLHAFFVVSFESLSPLTSTPMS